MNIVERFIKYTSFCTTSDENSGTTPSTPSQRVFAEFLKDELIRIGLQEVVLDDNGYIMATVPANADGQPVIGFIAHMDTSPDASGEKVQPRIVKNYDGKDIVLNSQKGITLEPKKYPEILNYKGQDIIVTDGTTLLGADDKAGVAAIVTVCEELLSDPSIKHGKIRIGFTPDEEIGRGADHFDVKTFGADFAYTIDGGAIGELEYENFNAASATITFNGVNVHPGYAYKKMLNSIRVANEFIGMLPVTQTPESTQKYEGFFHLVGVEGTVEQTVLRYIIRDHDRTKFEERKAMMEQCAKKINVKYGEHVVVCVLKDQYYNMKEKIEPVMYVVDRALKAMESAGIKPKVQPIRGGTDGARLSFEGLPCPNLFAGGENFHSRFEYLPIPSLEKAKEVVLNIARIL